MRQLEEGWYVEEFMDDKDFAEASTFKKNTTPFIALYKPLEIILTMSSYRLCTIKSLENF